jgi:hypothetical protein
MSWPEAFYFGGPRGLLCTLKIESRTRVLSELSQRDRDRFLSSVAMIQGKGQSSGNMPTFGDPQRRGRRQLAGVRRQ